MTNAGVERAVDAAQRKATESGGAHFPTGTAGVVGRTRGEQLFIDPPCDPLEESHARLLHPG